MMRTPIILFALTIAFSLVANANNKEEMKNSPCAPLFDACQSAGFQKDGGVGKDLWDDCKKPLIDGKTVSGVNVNQGDITKCKTFKQDKKAWMARWKKDHD